MFFLAIILNLLSSYFLASIFGNLLIIFIAFFALIVLNMEILSLFRAINDINLFIFTIINFIVTFLLFKFKKAQFLKFQIDFNRLKNALLLDKSLIVLSIAFLILLFASLFLALVMPVLEPDSQTYHFLRAYEFMKNSSLSHFETNDIRALIMPINSEILYSWMLVFKKNFYGYGIVSFLAYILSLCSMNSIFEKFKYSYRKRLYAIFLFSSLSAIIIQIPSLQTDLLVGSLLLCAFSLYVNKSLYFSSLSFALAMGVKSTGLMSLLGLYILLILYEILINKDKKLGKIKEFSLFLVLNFFIFSSYNYFLNLIDFNNPLTNHCAYLGHRFWGGFSGYISNLIHFFFQSFDFTGFKWGYYLNNNILEIKSLVFKFLNINPNIGCNVAQDKINIITDEQTVGFGILGFLVFLPMVFVSIFRFFTNKNKRTILAFILSLVFLINILVLARATAYMVFSIRFIVAFVCLASVILAGVYKKKSAIKPIILFFCLFYMILIPFHNKRMPFWAVLSSFREANYNKNQFEENCYRRKVIPTLALASKIYDTIKEKYPDKKKIAFIKTLSSSALYLKKLEYEGYRVDFLNSGKLSDKKIDEYDLIILEDKTQNDNVFNPWEIDKKYKIENSNIIFDSSKNYNCYYTYAYEGKELYLDDALERVCFSYPYLIQKKNLKKDYSEIYKIEELNKQIEIFYFVREVGD